LYGHRAGKRAFYRHGENVEMARYDWERPGEAEFRAVIDKAEPALMKILEQEVCYELHKGAGNAR
jgi:hypothetical protein